MAKAYCASSIQGFPNSAPITVHEPIWVQDGMRTASEQKNGRRDEMINAAEILKSQLARGLGLDKYAEIMHGYPSSPSFKR